MRSSHLPTIEKLTVRPVCVPLQHPHKTASGVITESPLVLCDITTSDNVTGHSLIFTYTKAALKSTATLLKEMEPLITGKPLAPKMLELELSEKFRLLGKQGLVAMAIAAIDMALWDALARTRHCSLSQLLGASEKPIKAYGGIGFDGIKGCEKSAAYWMEQGFTGVKAKIGYATADDDLAVVRAIRNIVGDKTALMIDYNQSLTPTEAIERLKLLENEQLTWIEEPTRAHDYAGHAEIAQAIKTPIQCGENWWGLTDLQHALDHQCSDYIMLDVMKIGGVTGWVESAALAHSHQKQVSSHLWPEISAQLLSATPTAHWLEYIDWWNPILLNPLKIENGFTLPNNAIGSGIEWNEERVGEFLV